LPSGYSGWRAAQGCARFLCKAQHDYLDHGRGKALDACRSSWRKACSKGGIVGVTFNDLRGTAVTRLALADCTEAEIATITGHSLRDVRSILDTHYLYRDDLYRDAALAESAIRKLEKRTESSK